jgi:phosphinothricin acetyltransferase
MTGVIRLATPADARAVSAIYEPIVRETIISFEQEPPTAGQMRERITYTLERFPWLIIEADEKVLGYAYAGTHRERLAYRWSVDVSVYVAPGSHRRGLGRRLYRTLLGILRVQGCYTALAGIALPNEASVGLHEAMGFTPVGVYRNVGYKLGSWRDVGWWALALRAYDPAPLPPRPLAALQGTAGLDRLLADENAGSS